MALQALLVVVVGCIGCGYLTLYCGVTVKNLNHWWKFNRAYLADPPTLSQPSIARGIRTVKAFLIAFYSIAIFGALRASLQVPQLSWIPLIPLAIFTHVVHFFMIRCFTKYLKHLLANKNPTSTNRSDHELATSPGRVPPRATSTSFPFPMPILQCIL